MNKNNYFVVIVLSLIFFNAIIISTTFAVEENENKTDQDLNSIILRILELVNIERAKYDLNPLILDLDLNSAAIVRSIEIKDLFEHKRPDGSSLTTISSKIQGENIASGQPTPEQAMSEWMDSPKHRANILSPEFTTLGIGYNKVENDTNVEYGTYYWIHLFGGIKNPEPIKITLIQVSAITISSLSYNKITFKWNSQNSVNADGFQIFKYDPSKKSYYLKKTLNGNKNNEFTDTNLSSLSNNRYKVRSYLEVNKKTYYGPYSSVVTGITKPVTPTIKVTSKNKKYSKNKKITITWNKVSKSSGYQIFKSKSKKGKYSLKKTVSSKSKPSYIESHVKKGTYYYKIRAYGVVNKKKIYSDFSSPKCVRVK